MPKLNDTNIKLAVQKEGRLTAESLKFLELAGLEFESYKKRLFSTCRNFPLEILFVRDDDIPDYVQTGTVDLGIVGRNLLYEEEPKVEELLPLNFGFCSLVVAVPKESKITSITGLKNKKVATSYPNSTTKFFATNKIPVKTLKIGGAVEVTPILGIAAAIVDLTATGSTLTLNDLKSIKTIYDSEAVLIANKKALKNQVKSQRINLLLTRFKGVLTAKKYKYIMMNAPKKALSKIQKITPGLKSPTVVPLAKEGWIAIHAVVAEKRFWDIVEKLKKVGAQGILVSPIEKMIL